MSNIFINRFPVAGPWGGGNNLVKSLYNFLPQLNYRIVKNPFLEKVDYIFLQSPKPDSNCNFSINDAIYLKHLNSNIKIILRVNECDARKGTENVDQLWIECSRHVDKTIFVSNWMKEYFQKKGWFCKDNSVIYNGVNLDHFCERKKIDNGKINIVTHHWSNNRLKGFDIYESLDRFVKEYSDLFTFTYIGRELGTFKSTNIVAPLFGEELGRELSKYDVYISGSRWDPGPNHILESIACQIPTYAYVDGGGSVEFVGENHTFDKVLDLLTMLKTKSFKKNKMKVQSWHDCIKQYDNFLKRREK